MPQLKSKTVYLCSACGNDHPKWHGQCPSCNEWGTLGEFKVSKKRKKGSGGLARDSRKLSDILKGEEVKRIPTGIAEMDRGLGGGLLPGSLILLGGNPGIGKSTLALQILPALKKPVLYVSAEESEEQIGLRARRLNVNSDTLHLSSENRIEGILDQVSLIQPCLLYTSPSPRDS